MTKPEKTEICQKCLEAITGSENQHPAPEMLQHLETCSSCAQMLKVLGHLRHTGSAFANESHPELKISIMRRLEPVLEQRRNLAAQTPVPTPGYLIWFFKLLPALALVFIIAVSSINYPQPDLISKPANNSTNSMVSTVFRLSLNNGAANEVSLDNPVSLEPNETAIVTVPDGSILRVSGPARLNVLPRGFHLAQGHLQAEVIRVPGEFIGTTPHGQITVLGTVFTVDVETRHTLVAVVSGRVKVESDGQTAVVLAAGEKTKIQQSADVSTQTETIPAVDSE